MTPTPARAQPPRGVGGSEFLAPWICGTNLHMHTKFHPNRSTQLCSAVCSHSEMAPKRQSPRASGSYGARNRKNLFSIFQLRTCSGTLFKHSERKNFLEIFEKFPSPL